MLDSDNIIYCSMGHYLYMMCALLFYFCNVQQHGPKQPLRSLRTLALRTLVCRAADKMSECVRLQAMECLLERVDDSFLSAMFGERG